MGKAQGQSQSTAGGNQQQFQQQQSTSTTDTGPWKAQQPYLENAFGQAQNLYGQNAAAGYYPGRLIADTNPQMEGAWGTISGLSQQGNPNVPAALAENLKTINGDYLSPDSNPWLKATYDKGGDALTRQYMTATAPQTAGAMAGAGRYGSGAYRNLVSGNEQNLGKSLTNLATDIYGGNYQTERGRQQTAVGMAPALAQARYIDPLMGLEVGNQRRGLEQQSIDAERGRYDFNRDNPTRALNTFLGQIQGNYGQSGTTSSVGTNQGATTSSGTQSTPYYSNPIASALGGGLGLASLFTGGQNSAANGIGGMFGKGQGTPSTLGDYEVLRAADQGMTY